MELPLLITACVLAALASLAAFRARLSVDRLLREIAAGRSRRASASGDDATGRGAASGRGEESPLALGRRIDALEERLRDLVARSAEDETRAAAPAVRGAGAHAASSSPGATDERDRVRRHLVSLGYEDVVFLPGRGPGGVLTVEAQRGGIPVKGSATVKADGHVDVRLADGLRAFP